MFGNLSRLLRPSDARGSDRKVNERPLPSALPARPPLPAASASHAPTLLRRIKAGYLTIEGQPGQQWKRRAFALAGTSLNNIGLYYFMDPSDQRPRGCIPLFNSQVDVLEEMIMVNSEHGTWFLCAESEASAEEWVSTIYETLDACQARAAEQTDHRHESGSTHLLGVGVGIGVGVMDTATASTNTKGGNVIPVPRGMQEDTTDGLESTESNNSVRDKASANPISSGAGGRLARAGPGPGPSVASTVASTVAQSPHADPGGTNAARGAGAKGSPTAARGGTHAHVNGATVRSRGMDPVAPVVGSGAAAAAAAAAAVDDDCAQGGSDDNNGGGTSDHGSICVDVGSGVGDEGHEMPASGHTSTTATTIDTLLNPTSPSPSSPSPSPSTLPSPSPSPSTATSASSSTSNMVSNAETVAPTMAAEPVAAAPCMAPGSAFASARTSPTMSTPATTEQPGAMPEVEELRQRDPPQRLAEFRSLFLRRSSAQLRECAAGGGLGIVCLRSVCWKQWLGCLPAKLPAALRAGHAAQAAGDAGHDDDESACWFTAMRRERAAYDSLLAGFNASEAARMQRGTRTEASTTGCMADHAETWGSTDSARAELLDDIMKDVARTAQTIEFFKSDKTRSMLQRVLTIWAERHPTISYRQGMNELLAVITYLLYAESWPREQEVKQETRPLSCSAPAHARSRLVTPGMYPAVASALGFKLAAAAPQEKGVDKLALRLLAELTNGHFIEHDAFALFSRMMERLEGLFVPAQAAEADDAVESDPGASASAGTGAGSGANGDPEPDPLQQRLTRIHCTLLSRLDPPLASHLAALGVEPQMYLLRWVRLMMSREFELQQVWLLWDAIFALSAEDFALVEYICVATVHLLREWLLLEDECTRVLAQLLRACCKVHAHIDVGEILQIAREQQRVMAMVSARQIDMT